MRTRDPSTPAGPNVSLGRDVSRLDADELARLRREDFGFVFQSYNLIGNATAAENVEVPAIYAGVPPAERHQRAAELLTELGLEERVGHRPNQLSGGQQQRAAIARTLAMQPRVILFDEPTSALDPEMVQEVLNVIRALADEGRTMLLVTHEMNFARQVSSQVVFLHQGLVEEQGTPEQVFGNPASARCKQFMSSNF